MLFNHFNRPRSAKGFTLIELLVVIAIIGILASVVLVSLNSARAKGRDAKRVAELSQIARAVALNDDADSTTAWTCTGDNASTCSSPALSAFVDPSSTTACAAGSALTAACDYTVSASSAFATAPAFDDWQVKTVLESGSGGLSAGVVCITEAGSILEDAGCK